MRKRHFFVLIGFSLCSWGFFTYYLFLQHPVGIGTNNKAVLLDNHLKQLENELREQKHLNEILLGKLRLVKSKLKPNDGGQEQVAVQPNVPVIYSETDKRENNIGAANHQPSLESGIVPHVSPSFPVISILLLACNRVTVRRSLDLLIRYRPSPEQFPIIVSQDCGHAPTADVIRSYGSQVVHIQQPDLSDIPVPPKEKKFKGYFKISRHYKWALNHTFNVLNYDTVVIVEDDLDIAPDFFEYFLGTYPLLKADATLWCVSAWNDNGKAALVDENAPDLLYRTDFFPGLGWMMTKDLWRELEPKWPKSYWDDWMRQPDQRKDRACIRPEVSRTRTFGKVGVSNGLFFEKHLKFIKLNDKFVPFSKKNLTYLLKDNYDVQFVKHVYESPVVLLADLKSNSVAYDGPVRITYHTKDIYKRTAKILGLMDDFKSGVPRTGYRGVVSFLQNHRRVYLAPNANWRGYDPTWS